MMKRYLIYLFFIIISQHLLGQVASNKYDDRTMFNELIALIINSQQFQELSKYDRGEKLQISSISADKYNFINNNPNIEFTTKTQYITLLRIEKITSNHVFIKFQMGNNYISYLLRYNNDKKSWQIYRFNVATN